MNGLTTCFLCNEETESNNHIWQCSKTLSLLKPIFDNHAIKLHAILTEHADSPPCIWQDSIRFCQLFSWTRDQQTNVAHHRILLTFLLNYIPQELLVPFQAAIKSKKKIKRLLLNFVHDLHVDIYTTIWKLRCSYLKEWKVRNNITRKSFTSYRRHNKSDSSMIINTHSLRAVRTSWQYRCPYDDDRRARDNKVMWIYFTSSNFLHNLPWFHFLDFSFGSDLVTSAFNFSTLRAPPYFYFCF
jgi:hypothetical protein